MPATSPYRPLVPGEFITNPDGSYSTEKSITIQLPDGKWVNVPSIYMTPDGIQDFSERPDVAEQLGLHLIDQFGYQFPTFDNVESAEMAARDRSENGGAGQKYDEQGFGGFPDISALLDAHRRGTR